VPVTDSVPDLAWLADSPVFIDSQQVGAFYDAVVGPALRTVELQVTASQVKQLEKSAAGHLDAGLSALFPWLKVGAGVETQRAATRGRHDGQSITFQPIDSVARQLVQLSLHYLVNQPESICVLNQDIPLPDAGAITASPRMIAFVDVPPGTRFLPQAAELDDGRVVTFFSPLIEKLQRDGGTLPVAYPGSTATRPLKVRITGQRKVSNNDLANATTNNGPRRAWTQVESATSRNRATRPGCHWWTAADDSHPATDL